MTTRKHHTSLNSWQRRALDAWGRTLSEPVIVFERWFRGVGGCQMRYTLTTGPDGVKGRQGMSRYTGVIDEIYVIDFNLVPREIMARFMPVRLASFKFGRDPARTVDRPRTLRIADGELEPHLETGDAHVYALRVATPGRSDAFYVGGSRINPEVRRRHLKQKTSPTSKLLFETGSVSSYEMLEALPVGATNSHMQNRIVFHRRRLQAEGFSVAGQASKKQDEDVDEDEDEDEDED